MSLVHTCHVRSQALEPNSVPRVLWESTEEKVEYTSKLWAEKHFFSKQVRVAGKTALWLRILSVLSGDPRSVPGTHVRQPIAVCDSSSRDLMPLAS